MTDYTFEQIEEIAGMILTYGEYMAHKYMSEGVPGFVKEAYKLMTPLEIRKKVEELHQNDSRMKEMLGSEMRTERYVSENVEKYKK